MESAIAPEVLKAFSAIAPQAGPYLATLLWRRGWRQVEEIQNHLPQWLNPKISNDRSSIEIMLQAIELLADPYVEITVETRSLIQQGVCFLQQQANPKTATQPGLQSLLECCNQQGDRPTDYFTGIGARLQALQEIHHSTELRDELFTTQDRSRAKELANLAELAYVRRRGLEREVLDEVKRSLSTWSRSSQPIVIAHNPQWETTILGSVATELAEQLDCPVMLLNTNDPAWVHGVARSPLHQGINFHTVLQSQSHLIHTLSSNPYAIQFTIAHSDLSLFTEAIVHQFHLLQSSRIHQTHREPDLWVSIAELNQILYNDLRCLEPYGIGNPTPRLGIRQARFERAKNYKLVDRTQQKIEYLRTFFQLCDDSCPQGIPGSWWGHYADELPIESATVYVYLLNNRKEKRYEVRLLSIEAASENVLPALEFTTDRTAIQFAISPDSPLQESPRSIVLEILGMAKYAARTGNSIDRSTLPIPEICQPIALEMLQELGFQVREATQQWWVKPLSDEPTEEAIVHASQPLLLALQEYQFQQRFQRSFHKD